MITLKKLKEFTISEEAYFGKNNKFVEDCLVHIRKIRSTVMDSFSTISDEKLTKEKRNIIFSKIGKELVKERKEFGETIAKHINAEAIYFNFISGTNAYCIPISFNSKLHSASKTKEETLRDIHNIEQTETGYRFRKSKGIKMDITLGLPLFDTRKGAILLEDREICAVLFHEIGHGFQHLVKNSINVMADRYLLEGVKLFILIFSILEIFVTIKLEMAIKKSTNKGIIAIIIASEIIPFYIILIIILGYFKKKPKTKIKFKDYMAKEIKKYEKRVLNKQRKRYDKQKTDKTLVSNVKRCYIKSEKFIHFLFGVINTIQFTKFLIEGIFGPLFIISTVLNKTTLFSLMRFNKSISKTASDEQFADYFPAAYGLGVEFSKAIRKINYEGIKAYRKIRYGLYGYLGNYVPIVSTVFKIEQKTYSSGMGTLAGYDTINNRLTNNIKVYERELRVNKNLSKEDRKDIEEQIKLIKDNYKKYRKDPKEFSFLMRLTNKFIDNISNPDDKFNNEMYDEIPEYIRYKLGFDTNILSKLDIIENVRNPTSKEEQDLRDLMNGSDEKVIKKIIKRLDPDMKKNILKSNK